MWILIFFCETLIFIHHQLVKIIFKCDSLKNIFFLHFQYILIKFSLNICILKIYFQIKADKFFIMYFIVDNTFFKNKQTRKLIIINHKLIDWIKVINVLKLKLNCLDNIQIYWLGFIYLSSSNKFIINKRKIKKKRNKYPAILK